MQSLISSSRFDHTKSYATEKDVSPSLLSHTRGNDSFSQSARGLCANLQNHFVTGGLVIFLSAKLQPLQYSLPRTRAQRKTEDTRQDKRAREEAFRKVSAALRARACSPLRKYQMITVISFLPLRFAPRSLARIDIISTITLRLVHVVIFRRLIAKAG